MKLGTLAFCQLTRAFSQSRACPCGARAQPRANSSVDENVRALNCNWRARECLRICMLFQAPVKTYH
eukprot:2636088-Pleurochrysis_carterae.AAC.1